MKNLKKLLFLFMGLTLLVSCSDDDFFSGQRKIYELRSVADPSISGTATFIQNKDNSTTVELQLDGTPAGGMHPAHIHFNTAVESGGIAVTLGTVNGDTGFSTTTFSELNDNTSVSFNDMLFFDGYINVHLSSGDLGTLVAQGDIGQNELTGASILFVLNDVADPTINGTATFSQRSNGEALAVLNIANTPAGGSHPAHIHAGSVANAPGGILFTFNPVNGDTGISKTNISALNDNTPFSYSDVLVVDGYINVHLSSVDLGTIVAQGDIGIN
jgi:hypothetical protein